MQAEGVEGLLATSPFFFFSFLFFPFFFSTFFKLYLQSHSFLTKAGAALLWGWRGLEALLRHRRCCGARAHGCVRQWRCGFMRSKLQSHHRALGHPHLPSTEGNPISFTNGEVLCREMPQMHFSAGDFWH